MLCSNILLCFVSHSSNTFQCIVKNVYDTVVSCELQMRFKLSTLVLYKLKSDNRQ